LRITFLQAEIIFIIGIVFSNALPTINTFKTNYYKKI